MKVSTEKIPDAQVVMTIEVEPERIDDARGKALRKMASKARVPGFRPGKAPPDMVRRHYGDEAVFEEALDVLVPAVYREALESEGIDPIARATWELDTVDPLVVKWTIPVRPIVELGDYAAIRIKTEPVVVDEERVEETIKTLRIRAATLEPIEREVGWRDVLRIDVRGEADGEQMVNEEDVEIQLVEERDVLFPGFEEQLLGHKKGEALEFDLEVPETVRIERLAGKPCHFTVTIKETKEEVLPELDEEFVKQIGEGFESVDALRDRIREDIRKHEEEQANNRYHEEILSELVDRSTIEYPPVMRDAEVDRMLQDQAGRADQGRGLESYLAAMGKTEAEVREEFKPIADMRLRRSLVLSEVAEAEHIEATDEEVEAELDKLTASVGAQAPQLRKLFGSDEGQATIRRNVQTRKTFARLLELASQDGPSAEATAELEQPKKRAKTSKKDKAATEEAAPADA